MGRGIGIGIGIGIGGDELVGVEGWGFGVEERAREAEIEKTEEEGVWWYWRGVYGGFAEKCVDV